MHNSFVFCVEIVCAAVILFRSIQIASLITWRDWRGHPLQFIGLTISYPFLVGGALSVLLNRDPGVPLLLVGMMLYFLSERRRSQ